ncbi:MAG: hypothetical protein KAW94_04445 [Candidatus Thorarchaeota archaeon]|nr:hypothetical protein [Candidatus Thorarchaeota archaeon]
MVKSFFVFMCPKCRNFTNAPVGQKRRRCSYCGKIINIAKAARALFDNPDAATAAVKEFNAARGGDAFEKAVERSQERVRALVPERRLRAEDISKGMDAPVPSGKRKRLMLLLEREATDAPCTLGRIENLCEAYQLGWTWVESQLTNLANHGTLIFPNPWSIRLVKSSVEKAKTSSVTTNVSDAILVLLKNTGEYLRVDDIIAHFQQEGVSQASVTASLERLMRKGDIFEPKPGVVSRV